MKLNYEVNVPVAAKSGGTEMLMRLVCLMNITGEADAKALWQALPEALAMSTEILAKNCVPRYLLLELESLLLKCEIVSKGTEHYFDVLYKTQVLKEKIKKSSYHEFLREQQMKVDLFI